ncbi:MAG: YicC/YloC family endoribonuclease [Pseudomonadota bacterium]
MRSMTGFASAQGALEAEGVTFRWDAKSVNGRGLDLKIRPPSGWDAEEPVWRAAASKRFKRGSVSLSLTVTDAAPEAEAQLNPEALAQAARSAASASGSITAARRAAALAAISAQWRRPMRPAP